MIFLLSLLGSAHAACSISVSAPADGTTATDSPTFSWGGNCAQYRIQFSVSGSFTTDTTSTAYQIVRGLTMSDAEWDSRVATWGARVMWRVDGLDSTGVATTTLARTLYLDPDLDDDGWSVAEGDCDDDDATVNPGAAEVCDAADQDCDTVADNGLEFLTWYLDGDADTYGDAATFATTCDGAPSGYVADDTDCDDVDATVNPGATEVCGDGYDQNCNDSSDGCSFEGNIDATSSDVRVRGYRLYSLNAGTRLMDVDGDGQVDLLAAAPSRPYGRYRGALYGWFGPLTGSESIGNADFRIDGVENSAYFGSYVSSAGDVDGDGFDDLLVTALTYGSGSTGNAGRTYLFLGPITGGLHTTAEAVATFSGYTASDYAYAVTGVGDLDGDGYGELVMGTSGYDDANYYTDGGWIDLWYGPITGEHYSGEGDAVWYGDAAGMLGYSVAAGDVDGDGATDLLLNAAAETERVDALGGSYTGTVRVCFGPNLWGGQVSDECPTGIMGSRSYSYVGYGRWQSMRVVDLNGDLVDDIVVGSTADTNNAPGVLYGCLGPFDTLRSATTCELQVYGQTATSGDLGSYAALGDLDGNGILDLAVGDPTGKSPVDSVAAGRVSIFYGPLESLGVTYAANADATLYSTTVNNGYGYNLGIYDLNADGVDDLVTGMPYGDVSGTDAGEVRVYFGGSL